MDKALYVEHLKNIGRKYFTRPENESPSTEMTHFEKCVLAGHLFSNITHFKDESLKKLVIQLLINGDTEDERALLDYIKNTIVTFYKNHIEKLLQQERESNA